MKRTFWKCSAGTNSTAGERNRMNTSGLPSKLEKLKMKLVLSCKDIGMKGTKKRKVFSRKRVQRDRMAHGDSGAGLKYKREILSVGGVEE